MADKAYKFEGSVIRLTAKDYDAWKRVYHAVPDLMAELYNLDLFYQSQKDEGKPIGNWFIRSSAYLNKKHQFYLTQQSQQQIKALDEWNVPSQYVQ